jgi:ornithine carbamoyltransferase
MVDLAEESTTIHAPMSDHVALMPSLNGRCILRDTDLNRDEINAIIDLGITLKQLRADHVSHSWLAGKTLGMIFQHPSTRTRTAFQAGMEQLGGQAIFLGVQDLQLRRGESIEDTAEIFSRYVNGIAVRAAERDDLFALAKGATVPVFNGLTSFDHPIEALSDLMTLKAQFGTLEGIKFAYLGDGNNVCHSLMLACAGSGVSIAVAGPDGFWPDPEVVRAAQALARRTGAEVSVTEHVEDAVSGANAVYTDVHESMGEQEVPGKLMSLAPYRVTAKVMDLADESAVFMHCLPLHRGQEVEAEVADGPQSIIFDQAENRLHVHKAVLLQALHDERQGSEIDPEHVR